MNFKNGVTLIKHYCINSNCNNEIDYTTFLRGSRLCASCSAKKRFKDPKNHPCFGIKRPDVSKRMKTQTKNLKIRKKISRTRIEKGLSKGKNNPMFGKYHSKETIEKIRQKTILRLKNGKYNLKPNKPEKLLNKVLQILFPKEYRFVGDGQFILGGFNPDFININGQKKIIEMFGDYWHNLPKYIKRDKQRLKTYKKYGYKTLIIWEYELKDLEKLISNLMEFEL